jgi:hypothetical protein
VVNTEFLAKTKVATEKCSWLIEAISEENKSYLKHPNTVTSGEVSRIGMLLRSGL